jgi:hypothetical protein
MCEEKKERKKEKIPMKKTMAVLTFSLFCLLTEEFKERKPRTR